MPRLVKTCTWRSSAVVTCAVGPPCTSTTSGGSSPSGPVYSGFVGRVIEAVGREAVGACERDGLRKGQVALVQLQLARAPQYPPVARLDVDLHDRRQFARRRRREDELAAVAADRRRRVARVRQVERGQLSRLGIEQLQAVHGCAREDAGDPAVVEEGVAREIENPLRVAQVGLLVRQSLDLPVALDVEVRPARSIGDEMEEPVGRSSPAGRSTRARSPRLCGRPTPNRRPQVEPRRDRFPRTACAGDPMQATRDKHRPGSVAVPRRSPSPSRPRAARRSRRSAARPARSSALQLRASHGRTQSACRRRRPGRPRSGARAAPPTRA